MLTLQNVTKSFKTPAGEVRAVNGVSLTVNDGEKPVYDSAIRNYFRLKADARICLWLCRPLPERSSVSTWWTSA